MNCLSFASEFRSHPWYLRQCDFSESLESCSRHARMFLLSARGFLRFIGFSTYNDFRGSLHTLQWNWSLLHHIWGLLCFQVSEKILTLGFHPQQWGLLCTSLAAIELQGRNLICEKQSTNEELQGRAVIIKVIHFLRLSSVIITDWETNFTALVLPIISVSLAKTIWKHFSR